MDATQRSADEAYTALHDSDNDPNRAVNLLLEGGTKVSLLFISFLQVVRFHLQNC